jgi:hypothetical protein
MPSSKFSRGSKIQQTPPICKAGPKEPIDDCCNRCRGMQQGLYVDVIGADQEDPAMDQAAFYQFAQYRQTPHGCKWTWRHEGTIATYTATLERTKNAWNNIYTPDWELICNADGDIEGWAFQDCESPPGYDFYYAFRMLQTAAGGD